jgi:flagellar protein FlaG
LTWINTTWSQQVATATPSPPAVVSTGGSANEPHEVAPTTPAPQQAPEAPAVHQPSGVIEATKAAAQQIESYLRSVGRSLDFRIDESTGRTVVTVTDAETGELVRQIPSEELLRLARMLGNQSPGTLIDTVA